MFEFYGFTPNLQERLVYARETSCMKKTSVRIRNIWIKQLCSQTVWDFATAFRVWNCFGTKRSNEASIRGLAPKRNPLVTKAT